MTHTSIKSSFTLSTRVAEIFLLDPEHSFDLLVFHKGLSPVSLSCFLAIISFFPLSPKRSVPWLLEAGLGLRLAHGSFTSFMQVSPLRKQTFALLPIRALSPVWGSSPEGYQLQLLSLLYPGREGVDRAEDTPVGHKGMNSLHLPLLSDRGEGTQQGLGSAAFLPFPSTSSSW